MDNEEVGVVIGRFQVASLSEGHEALIHAVNTRHHHLVILVGCHPVPGTAENPLDYQSREFMLREKFGKAIILPVFDCPTDDEWSRNIDRSISSIYPLKSAVLYGGRDSFVPHYHGRYQCRVLDEAVSESGTQQRRDIARKRVVSEAQRAGIISAAINRFPCVHPTVDVIPTAIIGGDLHVLLAEKRQDGGQLRMIGGFVDKSDVSLEAAALRELDEEAGVRVADEIEYVLSHQVDDWRYKGKRDSIMTSIFWTPVMQNQLNRAKASDDIDAVHFINLGNDSEYPSLISTHSHIFRIAVDIIKMRIADRRKA